MKDEYRAYDGITIDDSFALLEFVSWLRRSTRDVPCVLLSQAARGRSYVPLDLVRATVGSRAVTVLLDNAVQQSARNQLGDVNPYRGAARIFPPGDRWHDDYRLVPCMLPSLSKTEFLARIDDKLNALVSAARKPSAVCAARSAASPPASNPQSSNSRGGKPSEEPSLADVRGPRRSFHI
ncbi:MAG: hypothetical protein K2I40_06600, partial [Bifidobacterium castoris]|nr:hypothetical protein [Bifidobacterium castoris]